MDKHIKKLNEIAAIACMQYPELNKERINAYNELAPLATCKVCNKGMRLGTSPNKKKYCSANCQLKAWRKEK